MYFQNFPAIYYPFEINGQIETKIVTDITANVRIRQEILANITLFDEYDIMDGETPEIIANKVYGSPLYHWVIMLCNQRYDYINDFPLPQYEFEKHLEEVYGENVTGIHHYETENGLVVNPEFPGAAPVTNYNYEMRLNESKRRIKLISKRHLAQILSQFVSII